MKEIVFSLAAYRIGCRDSALLEEADDPRTRLQEQVIQSIGTDLTVTIGGVDMFLAAWLDPDHWSSDWEEKMGEDFDVDQFLADNITETSW